MPHKQRLYRNMSERITAAEAKRKYMNPHLIDRANARGWRWENRPPPYRASLAHAFTPATSALQSANAVRNAST